MMRLCPIKYGVKLGAAPLTYYDEVIADLPNHYWRLDDSGATASNIGSDLAGGNNNGIYVGAVTKQTTGLTNDGDTNKSAYFDPASDDSEVTLFGGKWWSGTEFTISFLCNIDTVQLDQYSSIVSWRELFASTANNFPFAVLYEDATGNIAATFDAGGDLVNDLVLLAPASKNTNIWCAVIYRDNGTCELWLNGLQVDTGTFTGVIPDRALAWHIGASIGFGGGVGEHRFKGYIDEVAFFDRALSSTRLEAHYAASGL